MKKDGWIKRKYQRLTTGFEHEESFDFVSWHAKSVLPRLRFLRENHANCPQTLEKKLGGVRMTSSQKKEKWEMILDKMIWAFKNIDLKNNKDVEKGLILFGKFYTDLRD